MEVWLFILGYLIHFAASCVLVYKIQQQRTVYGLSIDTQICYLLATLSRCVWYLDTRLVEVRGSVLVCGCSRKRESWHGLSLDCREAACA